VDFEKNSWGLNGSNAGREGSRLLRNNKSEVNMKPAYYIILFTLLVITAQASAVALASDSLMCKEGIVSVGDIVSDLVRKCGQPAFATQREQQIVEPGDIPGERIITTIKIDDWTFNFGPDRFQYRILLKNGRVWNIESLDYGY
jgi:hypothetical protein